MKRVLDLPSQPTTTVVGTEADRLDACLGQLHGHLKTLLACADEKVGALRSADSAALQSISEREAQQLHAVFHAEQERKAILARLAQAMPDAALEQATLKELIPLLPEPTASRIQARSQGLREISKRLQEKNGFVADVAQRLQQHIRDVFADVAKANQESIVYQQDGRHRIDETRNWIDAVG